MSINDSWLYSKEQEQTFRPTLMFSVVFSYGVSIYFSSAFGRSTQDGDRGTIYQGSLYNAVVVNQQIGALQSSSGFGIDTFGAISIDLANADGRWSGYEQAFGFGGAKLTAALVLFDAITEQFSPDGKIVFEGTCDPATCSGNTLTVSAQSTYNLSKVILPTVPVQRLCPNLFPSTYDQRRSAADDELSQYFNCGYSPDIPSGNAAGNYGPDGAYTSCSGSKSDCSARGMYSRDYLNRLTSRFSGSQWTPTATWKSRSYVSGKTINGTNTENLGKYNLYFPLTFGNTWVTGVTCNTVGDANVTAAEVVLGSGWYQITDWVNKIQAVVTAGELTPYNTQTSDLQFRWYGLHDGGRNGALNFAPQYAGKSDPYGNLLYILTSVYQQVAQSNNPLQVRALVGMRPIPVWDNASSWRWDTTNHLAWVVLELFRVMRPDIYAKIDIQSVINYYNVCAAGVNYRDINGNARSHPRFVVSLSLEKEINAAQVIEGLKVSGRLVISPDANGNIRFLGKQTLADQQPSPMYGSNNNSAIQSMNAYGATTWGYLAYDFDERTIIPNSFRIATPSIQSIPTIITANIQDEDNTYTPDTVSVASIGAYSRIQRKLQSTIDAIGLASYDQAYRVINTKFAELWRGNLRNDFGGSIVVQFATSFRAMHLAQGDIIRLSLAKHGFVQKLFRVEGVSPSKDCATVTVSARWHDDSWYQDSYGQT